MRRLLGKLLDATRARPAYEKLLELRAAGRGVSRVIDGETYRVIPKLRSWFDVSRERELRDFISARAKPGQSVLDVGAHIGLYALLFAKKAAGGRIHAFEPNPDTRAALAEHVKLNGFESAITIVPSAVAAKPGTADFFCLPFEGMSRLGEPNPLLEGRAKKVQVPVTTLDDHCAANGLQPDWLRMDIEGFELGALRGARRTIDARRGQLTIVLEMHPSSWPSIGESIESARRTLDDLGLSAVPLTGQKDAVAEYGIAQLVPR